MELEITPEPTPEERAAVEAALALLLADDAQPASAWWRAGVLDAVEDDEPDSIYPVGELLSSRGAARA